MVSPAAEVRNRIFGGWKPPLSVAAKPQERDNAAKFWAELKKVAEASAWRSTAILAGQLAEAHLRARLWADGISSLEMAGVRSFGDALKRCIERRIVSDRRTTVGREAIGAARRLRNESAHYALWKPFTSEVKATRGLVLAVMLAEESPFPGDRVRDQIFLQWLRQQATELGATGIYAPEPHSNSSGSESRARFFSRPTLMAYDLRGLRCVLFSGWSPPVTDLDAEERCGIGQLWAELQRVAEIEAWRSMASLCGQIVEAYLKTKLVKARKRTRVQAGALLFPTALEACREHNLIEGHPTRAITGADAVASAVILRNWSSHYGWWLPYTTELRATQALALVIGILESLFPAEKREFAKPVEEITAHWAAERWRDLPPIEVLKALRDSRLPATLGRPVYEHVIEFGTLRTILDLLKWAKDTGCPLEDGRAALHARFVDLLRKARRESPDSLSSALLKLQGIFGHRSGKILAPHAAVFGILLPMSAEALTLLFRKETTSRIPIILWRCRGVDEDVMNRGLKCDPFECKGSDCSSPRCSELIPTFWQRFSKGDQNPLNMANALGHMPDDVRVDFLTRIPKGFRGEGTGGPFQEWLRSWRACDGINLLGSLKETHIGLDKTGTLSQLKQDVVQALMESVRDRAVNPIADLHEIPLRLGKMLQLGADAGAKDVIRAVLERATEPDPCEGCLSRIVWDTYNYFPSLTDLAVNAAAGALDRLLVSTWDAACIAGMLEVHEDACCSSRWESLPWDEHNIERKLGEDIDRWQKLRAILAAFRRAQVLGSPPPTALQRRVVDMLSGLQIDENLEPSHRLAEKLQSELARTGTAARPT